MCGIFAICASTTPPTALRQKAVQCSSLLRHRGPDWSGVHVTTSQDGLHHAVSHERLAIIDPESGEQPIVSTDGVYTLAVNGEIYNYRELRQGGHPNIPYTYQTGSDCEPLIPLFQQHGVGMLSRLRGMWAFVLVNNRTGECVAARDHMGICPLYMGWQSDGSIVFASEMKALAAICARFHIFPPGHYYHASPGAEDAMPNSSSDGLPLRRWYNPAWMQPSYTCGTTPLRLDALRANLEHAVHRRMMTDVPWGVLLSGGLDSSLVAAIACRWQQQQQASRRSHVALPGGGGSRAVHSFTIGLAGSPDLAAAERVARFLGTTHHAYTFTVQQGLDAIRSIIYHLETYDITTVRASVPMYLMSRKIKSLGIKMVLSGEGADEALGGYLYFHKAPHAAAFHRETVDKLLALHQYDCLRANKAMAAWGIEARVPFLDADFLDHVMHLDTREKMCVDRHDGHGSIEKWPLRKAFDDAEHPFLPDDVLWRQKEQFSDGVGYNWIDGLKAHVETHVTDRQMQHAPHVFPVHTPTTKEGYWYRAIFESHFPQHSAATTVPSSKSIACSTAAALAWDATFASMADPSGRAVVSVHDGASDPSR